MTIYIPRTRKVPAEITIGSLCSGYEGIGMAVQALIGGTVVWVADNEPSAAQTLEERLPGVPNLGDITTTDFRTVEQVNILTAGFPCQDVSCAGARAGLGEGTRTGVWTHVARCIEQQRPDLVLLENVRGLTSAKADCDLEYCEGCMGDRPDRILRALGAVLADLAALGYDAVWTNIRASDTGAPHRRERIFILAWSPAADAAGDD
jgi:DNA (cytosine-5)-methyltransferase 1